MPKEISAGQDSWWDYFLELKRIYEQEIGKRITNYTIKANRKGKAKRKN